MLRRIAYALAALAVGIAAIAAWKHEDITRLMAVNSLFAEDRIVSNFSHMDTLFHSVPMPMDAKPTPLPEGAQMDLPEGWEDWLQRRAITGIVVLKRGQRVHESYHLGTTLKTGITFWPTHHPPPSQST